MRRQLVFTKMSAKLCGAMRTLQRIRCMKSSMQNNGEPPLSRAECLCAICREILLEPVTLPCRHTLCHPCFQMTVEKASLCCPFCRMRVSTWARRSTRAGTLIDKKLWEIIQRQYPEECKRRACGLDTAEDEFEDGITPFPTPQLCKPGEIRQEYEQEISKIEAERLKREEEEQKASEDYIKKLLAEEEEEQRLSLERTQRELEEQLKKDEELARMLFSDLNESAESSVHVAPVASPAIPKKSVAAKSCKGVKAKQSQSGDIERFLSPKSVNNPGHIRNGDILDTSIGMESILSVLEESDYEDSMPTLSPQPTFTVTSPGGSSLECDPPNLSEHSSVNRKALLPSGFETMEDRQQNMTAIEFSPPRCSRSVSDCGKWLGVTSTPEQKLNVSAKQTLIFLEEEPESEQSCLENSIASGSHAKKLQELEETLREKKLQEEQDRLMALKLQKLLDKEHQVSRGKGSPDEYKLRPKRSPLPQKPLEETPLKRPAPKRSAAQADSRSSGTEESSDENQKPAPKRRVQRPQATGSRESKPSKPSTLPHGLKILKPSNKQQTILDMFQRTERK
ncbi:E3 ubiquitin-protein ligase RNF168 [Gastrophryne carolinensis]